MQSGEQTLPKVIAVVLTWNDTRLSSRCIASVLASDYPNLSVVLVDNGSQPPCAPRLKESFPSIETVTCLMNRGFTGGANRGLERAVELGADYVFFLNNDTIVDQGAISHLVNALEANPQAGAASALLLYPGPERKVQFYTGTIHRDRATHLHPEDGVPHGARAWSTVSTEFAPACAILIRRRVLEGVGLFDESLGTNWEDYDWCVRLLDAGVGLLTVGSAEVVHDHGATTGRVSPYITYYFTRNRLICFARYADLRELPRNAPYLLRSLWWQVKDYGLSNWKCHQALLRGVFDFAVGVRGKGNPPGLSRKRD